MNREIETLKVEDVFHSGNYVIPIYQRNYAWREAEITQLIQDVSDYAFVQNQVPYYIGTLVVYERQKGGQVQYETIDGQQRLTTLNLLLCALHRMYSRMLDNSINYQLNLSFDARKISTDTLEVIAREGSELQFVGDKGYNVDIQQGYADVEKALNRILGRDEHKIQSFYTFLTQKVYIMRVLVPEDTDLNHYFEIMNSRGEQLEKHEVLKARLMEPLKDDEPASHTFHKIWEACSDMERYVQYGFSPKERSSIFYDSGEYKWNYFQPDTFREICEALNDTRDKETSQQEGLSLLELVTSKLDHSAIQNMQEESPQRFTSVINFSNFLLHVLRVCTGEDVSLDDKRLIQQFEEHLEEAEDKVQFVKDFVYDLLYIRYLFDNYIIKREYKGEGDQWSLKGLKCYSRYSKNYVNYVNSFDDDGAQNLNREILMLQSMFHVSAPTLVYKHWLSASLQFLYNDEDAENEDYGNRFYKYLLNLGEAYLYDRYLAKADSQVDFYDIIFKNQGCSVNKLKNEHQDWSLLNAGTSVENFIFNYLDFKLWKSGMKGGDQFEFSFRSSVEHYYPQNPIAKDVALPQNVVDQFGNLCLISRSKNSKLSNFLPEAKKDFYLNQETKDSLKQLLMLGYDKWDQESMKEHGLKMKEILQKEIV